MTARPGRYVEQPAPVEVVAVRYRPGADGLAEVKNLAQYEDPYAEVAEIPAWNAAVVRFGTESDPDWVVVPDGWWLGYRRGFLVALPDDEFTRRYQPALPVPDVDNVPF
jgi:hypothetical protein